MSITATPTATPTAITTITITITIAITITIPIAISFTSSPSYSVLWLQMTGYAVICCVYAFVIRRIDWSTAALKAVRMAAQSPDSRQRTGCDEPSHRELSDDSSNSSDDEVPLTA